MRASRPTPQGSSKSGAVDTGKQQPWKRKFAARDFRQDAPGIAPENRRTPSETGPWRGKLRKCRAILRRRKSRRIASAMRHPRALDWVPLPTAGVLHRCPLDFFRSPDRRRRRDPRALCRPWPHLAMWSKSQESAIEPAVDRLSTTRQRTSGIFCGTPRRCHTNLDRRGAGFERPPELQAAVAALHRASVNLR